MTLSWVSGNEANRASFCVTGTIAWMAILDLLASFPFSIVLTDQSTTVASFPGSPWV